MRPIDKFILHVVHNWKNELNEAYSEGAIKKFIEKFREEADDLNIQITDEQLKVYIQRFDVLKNSPKIQEKDLDKWSLGALIRLVTASKGAEIIDDEDRTPDVVYQDGGITIWNGSKEDNCITYGRGESWCITKTSWADHRYDIDRGYPTFYLAKNSNLSDGDKLSFIVVAVKDPSIAGNKRYVLHNRNNDPHYPPPVTFNELLNQAPWLKNIPNVQNILKYISLSSKEKVNTLYSKNAVNIREWVKLPFEAKKQYLVVRKGKNLFEDVNDKEFVSKYLPQYPQIAEFIARTPNVIEPILLLSSLDKFNNQDRRSITSNIQQLIDLKYLGKESFSFDVKKLLVILKKWNTEITDRLYITKDGSTIVRLKLGDDISIDLYQAEDDYPNIKLNKRTLKYLLDYPELDKIPFKNIMELVSDGIIDRNIIDKIIEKARTEDDSAIVVKEIDGKEILLDSNSFISYKIEDGKITKIPFTDEDVQKAFAEEKENTSFQDNVVNIIRNSISLTGKEIPPTIDKEAFVSIINSTPYDKRTIGTFIILTPDGESDQTIFVQNTNIYDRLFSSNYSFGFREDNWRIKSTNDILKEGDFKAYFAWMRNENKIYNSDLLVRSWKRAYGNLQSKKDWFKAQPPFSPTDIYAPVINEDVYYLVNKQNPRESLRLSNTGKLVKTNIPSILARQLIGATSNRATSMVSTTQSTAPVINAPRRGRPPGTGRPPGAERPIAATPAVQTTGEDINVIERMQETGLDTAFYQLPRSIYGRLTRGNAIRVNPNGDRGVARRNNILGNAGRVGQVIGVGSSKIYFIRLANQQIIASINVQPGNYNYILYENNAVFMNSPSDLLRTLQQRNLAEIRNYIIREYVANNPQYLDEVREMLRNHIAETKK